MLVSHGFILSGPSNRSLRALSYIAGHLGALGVALFFAISGHLITTLLLEEREQRGEISLRAFYTRRVFRILPPAYMYLATLIALRLPLERGEFASAALFFSNYWPDRSWYTQHFWSLSMEEHFYLLWPAALVWMGNVAALRVAGGAIFVIALWRPWSLAHVNFGIPPLQRTDLRLDAFLFAGALAILLRSEYRGQIEGVLSSWWFRIAATLALTGSSAWMLIGSAPSVGTLIQSALLPALIASSIAWRGSLLYSLLQSKPLRWVGRISYGLYLWQQVFLVGHSATTLTAAALAFIPRVLAIFAIAAGSYYLMERPLLGVGRRLSQRMQFQGKRAQVSCKDHESDAEKPQGCAGLREKARGQTT